MPTYLHRILAAALFEGDLDDVALVTDATCNQAVAVYRVFHWRYGRCRPALHEGLVEPAAAPKVARLPKRINNRSILSRKRSMHDLQAFAKNVWIVDGPNVRDMGVMFTTRMIVVKLCDGAVWVNSPVSVPFDTLTHITALGPVRYLVAGTPRHVWRLEDWHKLFPEAQLWAPRTTSFTLRKARLPLTGILGDSPYRGWADDFDQLGFKGNPFIEEVIFFHRESRTVILDDLIQIQPMVKGQPFRNALFKLEGVASPYGGVAVEIRLSFTDRNLARRALEKLLAWDFDKLIIAHGECIVEDARPLVERAFRWLKSSTVAQRSLG